MTQVLEVKQGNREFGHAGRVLDYLVTTFLAALARAIRHRCAKDREMIRVCRPAPQAEEMEIKPGG
jgi:hypothetical protein